MSRDPYIDLRTLAPEILAPIQPWVDAYLAASRYERHFEWRGLQLTVEKGPLVRASKLTEVLSHFTKLAAAAENTAKQQAAQIEAESGLAVAKGRANNLKERLMCATEAQAKVEQQLDTAQHQIAAQKQQIAALVAEKHAAEQRILDLARERESLASHFRQVTTTNQAHLASIAGLQRRLDDRAKLEMEITERAQKVLVDSEALDAEVQSLAAQVKKLDTEADELDAEAEEHFTHRQRLVGENRRLQAEAQDEARAAARVRAENVALKAKNAQLAAERQALNAEVQNLRVIEQRLRDDSRRWRAKARAEPRTAARDRAWTAGLVAAEWARGRTPCAA